MSKAKDEVRTLLNNLPDDCTIEDIQYHLYIAEKIQKGIQRSQNEQTYSQEEAERKFSKWLSK